MVLTIGICVGRSGAFKTSDFCVQFQFELLFRSLDSSCVFHYLKSFRRARIEFASSEKAVEAKMRLNDFVVCGQPVRCYFAQVTENECYDYKYSGINILQLQ